MIELDELLALLDTADWQRRFVAVTPMEEVMDDEAAIRHLLRTEGIESPSWFEPARLTRIDRALAERYLPVLFQRELAYDTERLRIEDARRAAELFLSPFGPETRFYATINLTTELVATMEKNAPVSYSLASGIFGSTLESGLFAVDPDGLVGGVDVGDED
jgi:hypothetical protein